MILEGPTGAIGVTNWMFLVRRTREEGLYNTTTYYGVTDVLTTNVTHVNAYTNNLCMQCLTKANTMKYGSLEDMYTARCYCGHSDK